QTGPGDVQNDLYFVPRPLDLDPVDPGLRIVFLRMLLDEFADLEIFEQQARKLLLGCVPPALVGHHDPDAEPDWRDFLTHSDFSQDRYVTSITKRQTRK